MLTKAIQFLSYDTVHVIYIFMLCLRYFRSKYFHFLMYVFLLAFVAQFVNLWALV